MNAKETLQKAGFGVIAERMDNANFAVELARQPLDGRSLASALDEWLDKKLTGTLTEKFAEFAANPELMAKAGKTNVQAIVRKRVYRPATYHVGTPDNVRQRYWWRDEFVDNDGQVVDSMWSTGFDVDEHGTVTATYNEGFRCTPSDVAPEFWQARMEAAGVEV